MTELQDQMAELAGLVKEHAALSNKTQLLLRHLHQTISESAPLWQGIRQRDGSIETVGAFSQGETGEAETIPGIFGTGMQSFSVPLYDGEPDGHYAIVLENGDAVACFVVRHQAWPAWPDNEDTGPKVISRFDTGRDANGSLRYRTRFDLTGYDPATVNLLVTGNADDYAYMSLNGKPVAVVIPGFASVPAEIGISLGFVEGVNVLDFLVTNEGGAAGLRVDLALTGKRLSPGAAPATDPALPAAG